MGVHEQYTVSEKLVLLGGGLLLAAMAPVAAGAEGDWFARPSLMVAGVYDDNLFFSPTQEQEDRLVRVSPAIEGGYRSTPVTLRALYTADAERYSENIELDSNRAREHAALDFRYEPTRSLTLLTAVDQVETETPSELLPVTGLEFQRVRAERFSVEPSMIYRFDRLNTGTVDYSFTRNEVAGDIGNETQTLGLGYDRQHSRRGLWSLRYRAEEFDFDTGDSVSAQVLLGGGTYQITRRTELTVLAGPRFSDDDDDSVETEASATLSYELEQGELGVVYSRTEVALLGLSDTSSAESLGATFAWSPRPAFQLRASSTYLSSEHDSLESDVTVVNLEAGYRLGDYLTLVGSYGSSDQRGSLITPGFGDITRNVVLIGLVISAPPGRPRDESARGARTPSTPFGGRL